MGVSWAACPVSENGLRLVGVICDLQQAGGGLPKVVREEGARRFSPMTRCECATNGSGERSHFCVGSRPPVDTAISNLKGLSK